ncbi:hypothetical protein LP421_30805 (plasmid) [Rhizobium sp. RCAM05350]|nr:hypothetical protein LP421_30805 [Rhizobium sp. RCAM05350]
MTAHSINTENVTPIYRFNPFDGGRLEDRYYKWIKTTEKHQVFRRADTGIEESFTHETFAALIAHKVRPFEHLPNFYSDGTIDHEPGNVFLGDLPEAQQAKTDIKITFVEKFLTMEYEGRLQNLKLKDRVTRSDAKMELTIFKIAKEMEKEATGDKHWCTWTTRSKRGGLAMPHPRTVRKWIAAYEEDANALNLVDARGGVRGRGYFTVEEAKTLDTFVRQYASTEKPTMVSLYGKMKAFITGLNEARKRAGTIPRNCCRYPRCGHSRTVSTS